MNLLASSEFDLLIGVIIMVIWGVAALAGKLKSAMNPRPPGSGDEPTPMQRLQQQIAEQIRQMQGGGGAVLQTPPPLPPQRRPPPRQQRRRVQPVAPPPPAAKRVEPPAPPVAVPPKPAPRTVQAPTIRRWLTPTTLRQQFILTELFQPPLSMREGR